MFKFAKYFFIVFLITTILPLVLMFVWNNTQMQKMHSMMSKNGLANGYAKLEQNITNNLRIQEGDLLKTLYFTNKDTKNLNKIKELLKEYSVTTVNQPVSTPVSFYSRENEILQSCTLLPLEYRTENLKICKPVDLQQLRPSGPYNIEINFAGADSNIQSKNIIVDPMINQYDEKSAKRLEKIFREKGEYYDNTIKIKDNNDRLIANLNIYIATRPNKRQIENIFTGFIILLVGIISSFVIGLIIQRVFVKPIMALSNATNEIKKGNFDIKLIPATRQEIIQRIYNSFNDMAQNLAQKEKLRQSFISNLTHDLRTPLVSQSQSLELISQKFKEIGLENEYELAESLAQNNEHLLKMVNLILESYSFDSAKLKLNIEKADLYDIIRGCEEKLKPLIQDKKIEFINNIYHGGTKIDADRFHLTRVFMNLLSNAIENTSEGCFIKINAHYTDADVVITIEDNGHGIAAEDLKFIFDRYYSGKSLERKLGAGFGLSVCEKLINLHKGTIKAESELNKFTRFTINLPQQQKQTEKGRSNENTYS